MQSDRVTTLETNAAVGSDDIMILGVVPLINPAHHLRLPHSVIVRAPGLLPMLYMPSELAQELGVTASTIREWLAQGAPHQRDARGYFWIDGRRFAAWVKAMRHSQLSQPLGDDEAYCLRCRQPVKLLASTTTQRGKHILLNGVCPTCGSSIHRGAQHGQSH